MDDKNNLLADLIKYLRNQNQRQRYMICGLVVIFAAALLIQNLVWVKFVTEMIGG